MTVKQCARGTYSVYCNTYNIGFINDEGTEDQTQFENVRTLKELSELFVEFCKENRFSPNTVLYIEKA